VPPEHAAVPSVMRYEHVLLYKEPELDTDSRLTVDLMFPAGQGTISRLMDAWWVVKVSLPCPAVQVVFGAPSMVASDTCSTPIVAGWSAQQERDKAAVPQAQPQGHAHQLGCVCVCVCVCV
jgi:hypothetical protein